MLSQLFHFSAWLDSFFLLFTVQQQIKTFQSVRELRLKLYESYYWWAHFPWMHEKIPGVPKTPVSEVIRFSLIGVILEHRVCICTLESIKIWNLFQDQLKDYREMHLVWILILSNVYKSFDEKKYHIFNSSHSPKEFHTKFSKINHLNKCVNQLLVDIHFWTIPFEASMDKQLCPC